MYYCLTDSYSDAVNLINEFLEVGIDAGLMKDGVSIHITPDQLPLATEIAIKSHVLLKSTKLKDLFIDFEPTNHINRKEGYPPSVYLWEIPSWVDIALEEYFIKHNQKVTIQIGDLTKELSLDPDFSLIIGDLLNACYQLIIGKEEVEISFPESTFLLKFGASGDSLFGTDYPIQVEWLEYGYSVREHKFTVSKIQVVNEIQLFCDTLLFLINNAG